jgi:hypothetical protein
VREKKLEKKSGGRRKASRTLLALLALAVATSVGEWGARTWIKHSSDDSLRATVYDYQKIAKRDTSAFPFMPGENLPYRLKPNYLYAPEGLATRTAHNEFGFRGKSWTTIKADDTLRILCLGGSATYGVGVLDNDHTYPARMREYLNSSRKPRGWEKVEVFNLGVEGYTAPEVLKLLITQALSFSPDVVLVESVYEDVLPRLYEGFQCDYRHFRTPLNRYEAGWLGPYLYRSPSSWRWVGR